MNNSPDRRPSQI